ncbi:conserved hypothetical protein [Hymenobacter roseosalivarius DSM 11622]|uniref:SMP-30/Gluconolaconase/LRE domain protein n=1 Tax=Hymenobacter roseosalivarius DSM 11622 TaxID=645990 RepID=A0A1W1VXE9_9BACT|nr:SMP-30/gluconolactonase/LRE family protein [Hymenobacter roseosalivarius]SMB98008.1 conserved hypothetical protein [Hymenobacter roseosalivarius DSM 11622]
MPYSFSSRASQLTGRALSGLLLSGLLAFASSCSEDGGTLPFPAAPNTITFTQPALYPEGVQYDAKTNRYFVSSLTRGAIGQVQDNGNYRVFTDDARLVSTIGLHLDASRKRLLAAVSDPGSNSARSTAATAGQLAALAIFNADNGQLTNYVNLGTLRPGGGHFANDIAVDAQGNAYVTDSFSPIIYKVDLQGNASIFLENSRLAAPAGAFGLNGIVYHPDGYLLVAQSTQGVVYKVPLNNPSAFTPVASAQSLEGADGLLLQDNKTLLVVSNSQSTIFRLNSTDNFTSATVGGNFATGNVFPTTLTRRGNDTYVLYAYLSALFGGQNPPVSEFSINKVRF